MYSRSLSKKHQSLIKHVYEHLDLKELTKLKLTIDEGLVANLTFLKTCAECKKECYQEKDIVICRMCAYWIHDDDVPIGFTNVDSCYTYNEDYGKCCSNCHKEYLQYRHERFNYVGDFSNRREYNQDGDEIPEFHHTYNSDPNPNDNSEERSKTQTVVSESCYTFADKLNRKKLSGQTCNKENESLPETINIPKIATNTSVESVMITDGNKNNTISVEPVTRTDGNKNNDNANIIAFDDIFNDKNLMNFVFQTIEQL